MERKSKNTGKDGMPGHYTGIPGDRESGRGRGSSITIMIFASVEETAESYHIACAGEELTIPKMYLDRDSVRSVRHHLMRYCGACYEQSFCGRARQRTARYSLERRIGTAGIEKGYMSYVRSRCGFYYTETKNVAAGDCACVIC